MTSLRILKFDVITQEVSHMNSKMFEVRDRSTCISVVATKLKGQNEAEKYLLQRAGFYGDVFSYILLTHMETFKSTFDAFKWDDRSMRTAHQYIQQNFDNLKTGDVIDVEFILGETKQPQKSLRAS